jgi:type II secretory pathway component PulF
MEKRTYTVTVKEKNSISTTKSHIQAESEQEVRQIVESRGAKVIQIQYGKY